VSGSYDEDVRVWNIATGKPAQILSGHEGFVYAVAFHPDNQQIVSGGYDGTVRLWDSQTGEQVRVFGE
ncbi:MAG: hypothetical protein F6K03_11190, partial [Kamptonema sp. SIO4C4]|nr:hypothetical protein [Kamptonema sp. SIO4C4]